MKPRILFFYFLFLSFSYYSCGPSTKIEKSWTDPSFTSATAKPFNKVLVVALLKDESTRRIAEDKMVAQIHHGTAVQSYNYLQGTEVKENEVTERLKKEGFDGVVVMRLADIDKTTSYVPGNSYGGWYGYYRYAAPAYYNSGYYTTDKTYYVETNIYSLESNKLLWSGMTSTVNPSKADKMVDDIISTIKGQMKKEGLVK
jgi:hypothetical protein